MLEAAVQFLLTDNLMECHDSAICIKDVDVVNTLSRIQILSKVSSGCEDSVTYIISGCKSTLVSGAMPSILIETNNNLRYRFIKLVQLNFIVDTFICTGAIAQKLQNGGYTQGFLLSPTQKVSHPFQGTLSVRIAGARFQISIVLEAMYGSSSRFFDLIGVFGGPILALALRDKAAQLVAVLEIENANNI